LLQLDNSYVHGSRLNVQETFRAGLNSESPGGGTAATGSCTQQPTEHWQTTAILEVSAGTGRGTGIAAPRSHPTIYQWLLLRGKFEIGKTMETVHLLPA
jgi:hypothetical protein